MSAFYGEWVYLIDKEDAEKEKIYLNTWKKHLLRKLSLVYEIREITDETWVFRELENWIEFPYTLGLKFQVLTEPKQAEGYD